MKIFIYIFLLIVLLSCKNKEKRETKNIDFFSNEISKYHGSSKIMDLWASLKTTFFDVVI